MYRTGLGDCFLLAFPRTGSRGDPRDAFYMLIDCGVFKATANAGERMRRIAEHIKAAVNDKDDGSGRSRIDVLVITHEHWDHVSAFHPSQAQDVFAQIELGALWLAWTEDETIPLAAELRQGRRAARQALTRALASEHLAAAGSGTASLIHKVLDFFGGATDARQAAASPEPPAGAALAAAGAAALGAAKSVLTEEAMDWLKGVYGKGKVRFLHPGQDPVEFHGVEGARVYLLGPPEDAVLIRRSNPKASGEEVYPKGMAAAVESALFAAFGVLPARLDPPSAEEVEEARTMAFPFDEHYQVKTEDAKKDAFFKAHYFDPSGSPEWRRIENDWLEAAGEFALQLDSATNNTSLAFALELGPPGQGPVLLFPGDAQVGNWLSWFGKVKVGRNELGKDMVWRVAGKTVDAADLLRRAVLYKVGHHGSHNATLRDQGLKLMGRPDGSGGLVAMLPVDELVARTKAGYGEMPLPSLVKDLLIRTGGRVMRSDEDDKVVPAGNPTLAGLPGAPKAEKEFAGKVKDPDGLYIEYTFDDGGGE
jgi:hypothetical protein